MSIVKKIVAISENWQGRVSLVGGGIILVVCFLVSFDAMGRSFFLAPIKGAVELNTLFLVWVVFLSFAYGMVARTHVRISMLTDRIPRLQPVSDILAFSIVSVIFIMASYASWGQFWHSWVVKEAMFSAVVKFPMYMGKMAVFVGSVVLTIQCLIYLMDAVSNVVNRKKG